MSKKILKVIDIIILFFLIICFFKLQGPVGEYEYALGYLIQLVCLFPSIAILFISVIMMITSLFDKNNVFAIISQICKIVFYVTYILIRKFVLHITVNIDILIIAPIIGVIGIFFICINKFLNNKKKYDKCL